MFTSTFIPIINMKNQGIKYIRSSKYVIHVYICTGWPLWHPSDKIQFITLTIYAYNTYILMETGLIWMSSARQTRKTTKWLTFLLSVTIGYIYYILINKISLKNRKYLQILVFYTMIENKNWIGGARICICVPFSRTNQDPCLHLILFRAQEFFL